MMAKAMAKTVAKVAKQGGNKLFEDLKRKSADELKEQLIALRRERFNLRFRQAQGQLEASHVVRIARRQIARIKTLLAQRDTETNTETNKQTNTETNTETNKEMEKV